MPPPDAHRSNPRVERSQHRWLLQLPFVLLAIVAPLATLSLPHLPRVLLGPNLFLSALPLANEIATIHFLQLVCVGLMVCAGIGLTRGLRGWLVLLSRLLLWSSAIATGIHDPILSVAANSVFRHWQGLSTSPEVILDAAGHLPPDVLIRLAHPEGLLAQITWCVGIGLTAMAWKRTGQTWLVSSGMAIALLFAAPIEQCRYIGLIGFGVMALVWERSRLQGNCSSSEST